MVDRWVGGMFPTEASRPALPCCPPEVLHDFRQVGAQRLPVQWLSRWVTCGLRKTGSRDQESCLCCVRASPPGEGKDASFCPVSRGGRGLVAEAAGK